MLARIAAILSLVVCFSVNAHSYQADMNIVYSDSAGVLLMDAAATGYSTTKTFTIQNTGSSVLTGTLTIPGTIYSVSVGTFSVLPSSSKSIIVTFSPVVEGTFYDTLTVTSNDLSLSTVSIPLKGSATAPMVSVLNNGLDFDSEVLNSVTQQRLPYKNDGIVALTVSSITQASTDSVYTLSSTSEVLAPGDSSGIFLTFNPDLPQVFSETLTVVTNAGNKPTFTITASGEGLWPGISTASDSINAGGVYVGLLSTIDVDVINPGTGTLQISNVSTTLSEFTVVLSDATVAPGDSTVIAVEFTPSAESIYNDSLVIISTAYGNPRYVVKLRGEGVSPSIELDPVSLNFGSVIVNSTKTMTDKLINSGNFDLNVEDISFSSSSYTSNLTVGTSVAPGDTIDFTVSFSPQLGSVNSDSMLIESNDFATPVKSLLLSGSGFAAELNVSDQIIAIGDTTKGDTLSHVLKLYDIGTDSLRVTNIRWNSPVFTLSDSVMVIAPGDSAAVTIDFGPDAVRSYSDTLTIFSNGLSTPVFKIPVTANSNKNDIPVITTLPDTTLNEGDLFSYTIAANDSDATSLTYVMVSGPTGMTFDVSTRKATWQTTLINNGSHSVSMTVTDDKGAVDSQLFTIVVSDVDSPPLFLSMPDTTHHVDSLFTYQVLYYEDESEAVTYSLRIYPLTPTPMTINASGLISWQADRVGQFPVRVRLTDTNGNETDQNFMLTVEAHQAPVIVGLSDTTAFEDAAYSDSVLATDWENDIVSYQLDAGPDGMTIDGATGQLSWTPNDQHIGVNAISVTVSDSKGNNTSATLNLTVTARNDAPVITGISDMTILEDVETHLTFTATDAEDDYLTFSDNSDLFDADSTGQIIFTPDNGDVGVHSLWISASDGAATTKLYFVLTIVNVNDAPVFTAIADTNGFVGYEIVLSVSATDIEGDSVSYALQSAPQDAVIDAESGIVSWTPTENQQGANAFVVAATDIFGGVETISFNVFVYRINKAPVMYAFPEFVFNEDEFLLIVKSGIAYDVDNNNSELSWTITGGESIVFSVQDSAALFSAPEDWNGAESFRFIISDPEGLADTLTSVITVRPVNDTPEIVQISSGVDTTINQDVLLDFTFEASDRDNDELYQIWFVNSDSVSIEEEYRFDASAFGAGEHTIELEVTDQTDTLRHNWSISVAELLTGIELPEGIPTDYKLSGAYPNPFNSRVSIPYALPKQGDVTIAVYNIKGQKVRTLVQSVKPAGYHRAEWDGLNSAGREVASGVYVIRMRTAVSVQGVSILLIK